MRDRFTCVAVGFALVACGSAMQKAERPGRSRVEFAEKSFIEVVTGGKAPVIAGRVAEVNERPEAGDVVQGDLVLDGIREITRGKMGPQSRAYVSYAQYRSPYVRMKSGGQGWNGVDIRAGTYLVAALEGRTALAVRQVGSPDDRFVRQLEWMVRAEEVQDAAQRSALLRTAAASDQNLLQGYAHYAIGRLQRVPRNEGATIEIGILQDAGLPEGTRIAAATNLELALWKTGDAEDPVNQHILRVFLATLPGAGGAVQEYLTDALYRTVIANAPADPQYARKLRAAASTAPETSILAALTRREASSESEEDRHDIRRLIQWVQSR
jgi:hypothetical protein